MLSYHSVLCHWLTFCLPFFQLTTKTKFTIQLDKQTTEDLENEVLKPRHHRGVDKVKCISVPDQVIQAIRKALKGTNINSKYNFALSNILFQTIQKKPFGMMVLY